MSPFFKSESKQLQQEQTCLAVGARLLSCSVVQCDTVSCSVMQCAVVCYNVLHAPETHETGGRRSLLSCSVVQCDAMRCSELQCVAGALQALQGVAHTWHTNSQQ